MTLDEILSGGDNAVGQLKKNFTLRAYKSRISNLNFSTSYFNRKVEDAILGIADGNTGRFGFYNYNVKCCDSDSVVGANPERNKLPEEIKPELINAVKESAYAALNKYKKDLDDLFGGNEEKPEVKVEVEVEKQPEQAASVGTTFASAETEVASEE